MSVKHEFKFGQRVRNTYAGEGNPQRECIFVRKIRRRGRMNPGLYAQCTDGRGKFWELMYEAIVPLEDDKE